MTLIIGQANMNTSLRNMSLAFALMVSAAPLMTVHADAKTNFMADCSAKFKAAKAANTLGADTKWTDFMKHQCATDATATDANAAAPAAPAAVAPAATPVKVKKVKTPAATAPVVANTTTTPSGSFMQNCSTAWKALKAAGTVPEGMDWKAFVAAKCVVTPVAAVAPAPVVKPPKAKKVAPVVQEEVPAEPTATVDTSPVKTVDKNGKAFTPGQLAAHARARACGAKWRGEKEAGTLQAGIKWPQYWSACNTQMKAAGQ
jgi:hypothetical protein